MLHDTSMYKRAARVYQRLKAQKVVGKKAKARKVHGILSLPGLDSGTANRDRGKTNGKVDRSANPRQVSEPVKSVADDSFPPSEELQVARGLLVAFSTARTLTLPDMLRKMPVLRPSDDRTREIILAFAGRDFLAAASKGRFTNLSIRKIDAKIKELNGSVRLPERPR